MASVKQYEFCDDIFKHIMSFVPDNKCEKCKMTGRRKTSCKCKKFVCDKCVIRCEFCAVEHCLCCIKKIKHNYKKWSLCRGCHKSGARNCLGCDDFTLNTCENCDEPYCGECEYDGNDNWCGKCQDEDE